VSGSRSPAPLRRAFIAAIGSLIPAVAAAQVHYKVDPKTSLVWWQMSPHLNHLWGTTCPEDRSWRPGENRSPGWRINPRLKLPETGFASMDDTVNVPLFPRDEVEPVCAEQVAGEVDLPDTVTYQGAHGSVRVKAEGIISGQAMRDMLMHQVLETQSFPEITFTLDSVVGLKKEPDAMVASALGTLTLRGVQEPIVAALRIFPDAGGIRVLAKWRMTADTLSHKFIPKVRIFGLGSTTNIWHDFFMGADLIFVREEPGAN
jgi:polyisoprenoid-binding protein YceI